MLPNFVDEDFKDWFWQSMSIRSIQDLYELYLNEKAHKGFITDAEIERFTAYIAEHDLRDLTA